MLDYVVEEEGVQIKREHSEYYLDLHSVSVRFLSINSHP